MSEAEKAAGKGLVNKAPVGHSAPNRADFGEEAFEPASRGFRLIGILAGGSGYWRRAGSQGLGMRADPGEVRRSALLPRLPPTSGD